MDVALIGTGYWGSRYLRVLRHHPDCNLIWISDSDERTLRSAEASPEVARYSDFRVGLAEQKPALVMVVTPASTHLEVAQHCLNVGVRTFVEKPLTTSESDARTLINKSIASGVPIFPGHIYSFHPAVTKLTDALRRQVTGEMRFVSSSRLSPGPVRSDTSVIWDLAPHDLTILFEIGLRRPGFARYSAFTPPPQRFSLHASFSLEFGGGIASHSQVGVLHPEKIRETVVVGDLGMLRFSETSAGPALDQFRIGLKDLLRGGLTPPSSGVSLGPSKGSEPLRLMIDSALNTASFEAVAKRQTSLALESCRILETVERGIAHHESEGPISWEGFDGDV